jgi:hypothetical protein
MSRKIKQSRRRHKTHQARPPSGKNSQLKSVNFGRSNVFEFKEPNCLKRFKHSMNRALNVLKVFQALRIAWGVAKWVWSHIEPSA